MSWGMLCWGCVALVVHVNTQRTTKTGALTPLLVLFATQLTWFALYSDSVLVFVLCLCVVVCIHVHMCIYTYVYIHYTYICIYIVFYYMHAYEYTPLMCTRDT